MGTAATPAAFSLLPVAVSSRLLKPAICSPPAALLPVQRRLACGESQGACVSHSAGGLQVATELTGALGAVSPLWPDVGFTPADNAGLFSIIRKDGF